MALTINTNVASLNAQRNLTTSSADLATSLQRLSSGLRINSAKDDAAGLAISERMSTQIRGMNVAMRNANDGISLAQTAEGSLDSVSNALQRIRELAVQSANATNSVSDRAALDTEAQQLKNEINRIATQTNFNGITLMDGSFTNQTFQVGANNGETISVNSIINTQVNNLGNTAATNLASSISAAITGTAVPAAVDGVSITGTTGGATTVAGVAATDLATATAVDGAAITGVTANTTVTAAGANTADGAIATGDFTINGTDVLVTAGTGVPAQAAAVALGINNGTATHNVVATLGASNEIILTNNATGGTNDIVVVIADSATATETGFAEGTTTTTAVTTYSAIAANDLTIADAAGAAVGIGAVTETLVGGAASNTNTAEDHANKLIAAINAAATGVTATLNGTSDGVVLTRTGATEDIAVAFAGGTATTDSTGLGATTTVNAGHLAAGAITIADAAGTAVNVGQVLASTTAGGQATNIAAAINLISGSTGVTAAVGGTGNDEVTLSRTTSDDITVGLSGAATTATTGLTAATTTSGGIADIAANDITITNNLGVAVNIGAVTAGATAADQATSLAAAINAQNGLTGVTASVTGTNSDQITLARATGDSSAITVTLAGTATLANTGMTAGTTASSTTFAAITANDITIAGADGTAHNVGAVASGADAASQAGNLRDAINAIVHNTGVTATIDTATPTQVTLTAAHDIVTTVANTATLTNTGMTGSTSAAVETVAATNGFASLNLNTVDAANKAIDSMDAALTQVNTARADLGAVQTRFESVVSNLAINSENATAARGRIVDADFAAETAMLTRNQILQQAGVAMLAQANSIPQNVLSLLR